MSSKRFRLSRFGRCPLAGLLYPIGVGEVKLWRRSDSDLNSRGEKLAIDAKWVFGVQDVVCG
ncbi:MAG: hypothetical protein WHT28_04785, partial [Fimbriimonadales bacterium]